MYIPGSDFGSRWDVEFTFAPADKIRHVLLPAITRISHDTLCFEGMGKFDPGLRRIDIRPEVAPVVHGHEKVDLSHVP